VGNGVVLQVGFAEQGYHRDEAVSVPAPVDLEAKVKTVLFVFRGRAKNAREEGREAAALAYTAAADRIAAYKPSSALDLLSYAFDQAVYVRQLDAEKVLDWLDDQVERDKLARPWKTAPLRSRLSPS
jgi:hypothetical protein